MRLSRLLAISCGLAVLPLLTGFARAATTSLSATITPGALTLAAPPTAAFSSLSLDLSASQSVSASLPPVTVTDSRGSGAGWAVTATAGSFSHVDPPVAVSGSSPVPAVGGTYKGDDAGTYAVTIVAGGPLGSATYAVSGFDGQAAGATGTGVPLGTRGLSISFPAGNYAAGDRWNVAVSVLPVSGLSISSSLLNAVNGSSANLSLTPVRSFSSSTEPLTILAAPAGYGQGAYAVSLGLSLAVPASARVGAYAASLVETAS